MAPPKKPDEFLKKIKSLGVAIDKQPLRSRMFIFGAGLFLIYFLWSLIFSTPLNNQKKLLQEQTQTLQTQVSDLQEKIQKKQADLAIQRNQQKRMTLEELRKKLDQTIKIHEEEMIPRNHMAEILRTLLLKNGQMRLISLNSLPSEPVITSKKEGVFVSENSELFTQPILLTFSGSFSDTLNYLKKIETTKWVIFWDSLNYTVKTYPEATIELKVHTLSREKEAAL